MMGIHFFIMLRLLTLLSMQQTADGLSFDVAAPGISARGLLLGKHYSPSATNMQAQYPGSG